MLTDFNTNKGQYKGPDVTETDNNGLLYTADVLEGIYTNKDFPKWVKPGLSQSMAESGKSRADLWAFAALVAIQTGVELNNRACKGKPKCK